MMKKILINHLFIKVYYISEFSLPSNRAYQSLFLNAKCICKKKLIALFVPS